MESGASGSANKTLLLLAAAGFLWWLVDAWLNAFPWQQGDGYSLTATAILLVSVAVAVACLLRNGGATLIRNPLLLVPLGILTLAQMLVGLVATFALFAAVSRFSLLSIPVELSLHLVVMVALAVAYAAWVTRVLLDARATGKVVIAPASRMPRDFLRAALFMTFGVVGLMVPCGMILTWVDAPLGVWLLPVWSFLWNGLTVAFLPMGLTAPTVGEGFRRAFAVSRNGALWAIVLLHHILLGFVVYFSVSGVTETSETTYSNGSTTHRTHRENWNRSGTYTQAVWTGAYESDFRWHDKLMANIVQSRGWPPAVFALGLLAAALAIVVKIEVIRRLPLGSRGPPAIDSV